MQELASVERCWVEVAETARRLGVSVWTVRHLAETGQIPYVRFGPRGRFRFLVEDIDALLERSHMAAAS